MGSKAPLKTGNDSVAPLSKPKLGLQKSDLTMNAQSAADATDNVQNQQRFSEALQLVSA